MSTSSIHCPCGELDKGFMIGCDSCETWFHGRCAQVNAKAVANQEKWFCRWCVASNQKYCELLGIIRSLQEELKTVKVRVGDNDKFLKAMDERNSAPKHLHMEAENIKNLTQEVLSLKKELSQVKEERDILLVKCESNRNKEEELRSFIIKYESVVKENEEVKEELGKLSVKYKENEGMKKELLGIIRSLQDELKTVKERVGDNDKFLKAMDEKKSAPKHLHMEAENIKNLTQEILSLKKELSQVKEERDILLVKCESNGNKEEELRSFIMKYESIVKENEEVKEELGKLSVKYEENEGVKKELESLLAQYHSAVKENKMMKDEMRAQRKKRLSLSQQRKGE